MQSNLDAVAGEPRVCRVMALEHLILEKMGVKSTHTDTHESTCCRTDV